MENIKLGDLYLSKSELDDIVQLVAKKRHIKDYQNKSNDSLYKIFKKQSKTKKRIDNIREDLKDLSYKLSKSELKNIKAKLCNTENPKKISSNKTSKYLDELGKKILKLDEYRDYDDYEYKGIKNIKDLFKTSISKDHYKPKLVNSGYNNNYVEYESRGDRILSVREYLTLIEKYLRELINKYKNEVEWKVQLSTEINFISLKLGSDETRVMYTRIDNEEFMSGDNTNEIIKLLFESFLQRFEENLQNKMRGSEFEFDGINFNKTSIYRGGTYIDSPKWLKDNKSTINPKSNDDKCFQYAVTLALNLDNIDNHPERISKIKPFIKQYNWKDIDFPPTNKDWRKLELNNDIALNILYIPHNTKKIQLAYRSKNNLTCDKQVILLTITDGEKWHYLVVKHLPALLKGMTSTHEKDFYCLNCFHSYRTKSQLESHKKICENHDYCHVEMPTKDNNIIKYNHGEKSMKVPFVIYADLECLLEKMSTRINNPNESSTTKINKHTPSGYSIFTSCSFDESRNKLNYSRGKDCIKKFCEDLRIQATKIINYEKKKIILLTTEEKINYNHQKVCYICKKEFDTIHTTKSSSLERKKNYKVRDHCHYMDKYRGAAHNICNLRYKVPKEIPAVFHNGSTYDYHFITKELVKEFEGNFDCLGENTEKYITFSVPLKKKIEITYKIKFIDSFRFMSSSLSKLVDNLSEGIHNNKCADCKSNLDYIKTKNEKLILECYNCKQRYRKKFNKELIKRFASTNEFCNNNLNKFILLLRKGVYPYEYADTSERFSEISLPSKEDFYSNLNMEDISDIDYRHANNVFKRFKLENLGNYHNLYVQSDTLLLADVFNNFRDMYIKE